MMQLYYATRDGQSRRIADHVSRRLGERGVEVTAKNLAVDLPSVETLTSTRLVALIASVRYGHHLKEAEQFLTRYQSLAAPPPLVLASVNLTARKQGKDTAEGNAYLRKWIARRQLTPVLATAIAGRLDYPLYGWLDRQMIRLIMKMTGGPTDPRTTVEYTAWDAVDRFAWAIADLALPSE
ncbi:menaquinone-dependent protoporphyrinogen IX dehydrogenase [Telmatospirillum sp.]|uniref:menaquinone-dependent protoporphyrinogen IX dehydrogenase n=1 Tax=Telmatospirillum sp. TaxID=2079197 RepID=UPI002850A7E4|nr:menaquinone-dependent protoporphyrinogen IX dehydrogenase [Telmatospirillum sp.]MDR3436160.1 menaquinone-dependent protoporphyrinogen IX dehydrogenase [Telmatospirillum sp.]